MRKLLVSTLCVMLSSLLLASPVRAQDIFTRDDLNFDEALSDQEQNIYGYIDAISVVNIEGGLSSGFSNDREWMKGLYYYMITHLGFFDIPFHYIVTWQGNVFEGRGGGCEVNSLATYDVAKDYNNPLLIAYFDNGRGLTNQGREALSNIVGKSMSSFSVDVSDVFVGDVAFKISDDGQPSTLGVAVSTEGYLVDWLSDFIKEYQPGESLGLELSGEVESVSYDEKAQSWGDINVSVVVKNTGDYPWYNSGAKATYLATSSPRSHSSNFYNAEQWASFSRVVTANEELVMPGESATFEFIAKAPILEDTYTEKFELLRLPGSWIENTVISMTVDVSQGSLQLVKILETGTGALTVRSCGHPNCEQISAVEVGYVTILLEEKAGWSKIVYDGTNIGWVYGQYVKKL